MEDGDPSIAVEKTTDVTRDKDKVEPEIEPSSGGDVEEFHNGQEEEELIKTEPEENVDTDPTTTNGKDDGRSNSVFSTGDEDEDEEDFILFNRQQSLSSRGNSLSPETVLVELEQIREERDSLMVQLTRKESQDSLRERSFQEIAKELEGKCFCQQEQIDLLQEQLSVEQEKSRASVASLQSELALRVDQVTKMYEEAVRERESVVSRLAVLDKDRRELIDSKEDSHKKIRELNKSYDKLQSQYKSEKAEVAKLQAALEKQETSLKDKSTDLSKVQEELSSVTTKLKWTQNKLKSETDSHESSKKQLQATSKKFTQAKEEGEQLRSDLKATINTYQESEEMKSNSLGIKLKKTEDVLRQQEKEKADHQKIYELNKKELDSVKVQLSELEEEQKTTVEKLQGVELKLSEQTQAVLELTGTNSRQAERIGTLRLQAREGERARKELESLQGELKKSRDELSDVKTTCEDLQEDLASCRAKEDQLLSFTEKLSSSNAGLQAQKTQLEQKVSSMGMDNTALSQCIASMEMKSREVEDDLAQTIKKLEGRIAELNMRVEDKGKAVEQLSMDLEDAHNQVRVMQRKNASSLRDLTKQLQHYRKHVERLEKGLPMSPNVDSRHPISPSSATSTATTSSSRNPSKMSVASLAKQLSSSSFPGPSSSTGAGGLKTTSTASLMEDSPVEEVTFSLPHRRKKPPPLADSSTLPIDKSVLVDKLCRAQRKLAKLEEKVDFLEEHSRQLTEDIQKKSRIIQFYVTREESGTLAPSSTEENKATLARRGGIMASLYHSRAVDSHMSLELSLEISRKLQAVLEDTLLKNITLKENIDTLGGEIARLSELLAVLKTS